MRSRWRSSLLLRATDAIASYSPVRTVDAWVASKKADLSYTRFLKWRGILETERRDTVNKVPFLGDVPGLGYLFRSKSKTDNKDELLIFVTPKILREGAEIY